ncbi:MAG: hypothetical protein HFF39_04995 [Lawsonibacter sp.]|nr:hypothetical protein [Lawsonibacter sp.]
MSREIPRTWFSTSLSGSARAAEGRIRNVFQKNKKRPPLWLMALCAAVCLLCGSLVSCQGRTDRTPEGPASSSSAPEPPEGGDSVPPPQTDIRSAAVLERVSAWLEAWSREEDSALALSGGAAQWRIVSLLCPDSNVPQELTLTAQAGPPGTGAPCCRAWITLGPDGPAEVRDFILGDWNTVNGFPPAPAVTPELEQRILDCLNSASGRPWNLAFPAGREEAAEEHDLRVERIEPVSLMPAYEVQCGAYRLEASILEGDAWTPAPDRYVLTDWSCGGELYRVRALLTGVNEEDLQGLALSVWPDVSNPECALWRTDQPWPIGPDDGTVSPGAGHTMAPEGRPLYTDGGFLYGSVEEGIDPVRYEVLAGREPVYDDGDFWLSITWEGLDLLAYYRSGEGKYEIHRVETTRFDTYTSRHIAPRVSTRQAVLEAYPEGLRSTGCPLPGTEGEDCLWFDSGQGDIAAFLFGEDGRVSRIVLGSAPAL